MPCGLCATKPTLELAEPLLVPGCGDEPHGLAAAAAKGVVCSCLSTAVAAAEHEQRAREQAREAGVFLMRLEAEARPKVGALCLHQQAMADRLRANHEAAIFLLRLEDEARGKVGANMIKTGSCNLPPTLLDPLLKTQAARQNQKAVQVKWRGLSRRHHDTRCRMKHRVVPLVTLF